jgi:hypothetical protein
MKGYKKVKSKKVFQSIDGFDSVDERYEEDSYSRMFIERYYAFKDWFSMHLPNIYYSPKIKKHMWWVLDFMENFDEVDDYMKIRVNEKFREKYPESKETTTRYARAHVYEQYLHFIKEWEKGIVNPIPAAPTSYSDTPSRVPVLKKLSGGGNPKYKRNWNRYKGKNNYLTK